MKATSYVQQPCPSDQSVYLIKNDADIVSSCVEALSATTWSSSESQREFAVPNTRSMLLSVPIPLNEHKHNHNRVPSFVGVGFNLRKRTFSPSKTDLRLATCNSAFLSGLFADIANAKVTHEVEAETQMEDCSPGKKSRLTMSTSISRCGKSFANLAQAAKSSRSSSPTCMTQSPVVHVDSLSYQLHCVSSTTRNESQDIGKIAFPHLPATVSDSSCSQQASLTRRCSGQLRHEPETTSGDSYGWFVNMDDDETVVSHADSSNSLCNLAFSAATAPKSDANHDAEVEWAKAADTVDDVLGDFF